MTPIVLDISHHNTVNDFGAVKEAGILGVIHKATQGTGLVDSTYAKRRKGAEGSGLLWGAYHFTSNQDPIAQADHFLDVAKPGPETLLALDWEDSTPKSSTMRVDQARAFLNRVMEKTGRDPSGIVIYGGNTIKERVVSADDCAFFGRFPLWLCQYGPRAKLPKAWDRYFLWQYSDRGKIAGMGADGMVDFNVHGGEDLTKEWACIAPAALPAPAPVIVPPAVTPKDLVPVSRKAGASDKFKKAWQGISIAGVLSSLGMAKDTATQVQAFIGQHWLALLITFAVLCVLFAKWLEGLMAEDVNEGRAVPSGGMPS